MTPQGVILKSDFYAALVSLILTSRLLPMPDTAEGQAYRDGFVAGLAAAATAAGLVRPNVDRMLER